MRLFIGFLLLILTSCSSPDKPKNCYITLDEETYCIDQKAPKKGRYILPPRIDKR